MWRRRGQPRARRIGTMCEGSDPARMRRRRAAARASTAGPRWPAPTCSAPTKRPPTRCGCAWCARRMPARASRSATWRRCKARTPGLVAILTANDVPGENSFGIFPNTKDQPVLAPGRVRFRGEAVLALVGTRQAVESISDADLPITWTPETPVVGDRGCAGASDASDPRRRSRQRADARQPAVRRCRGRTCRAPPRRPRVASRPPSSSTPTSSRRPAMPCLSASGPDRIEVTACTQAPYMDLEETARVLGVDPSRVRIRPTACGGGFGGKLDVSVQPLLAVAAWVTQAPGAHRLHAHGVHGLHHQAASGAHLGQVVGRRAGPAHRLRDAGRLQHGRLRLVGADGGQPRAGARHGALQGAQRARCARAPSTPTTRPPAPSAASACRRPPSRTRR